MEALKFYLNTDLGLVSKSILDREVIGFVKFANLYIGKFVHDRMRHNVFHNMVSHFEKFEEVLNVKLNCDNIGKEMLDRFTGYLRHEKRLADSTAGTIIRCAKLILRKCSEYGYAYNPSYTESRFHEGEIFAVALEKREIACLYYARNCGFTKRQEEVKDLFVLQCQTGLRFSDLMRLSKEHIIGNTIHIVSKKTRVKVCIPMNKYVREIFGKYNLLLPSAPTIQSYNKIVKEICRKAGLTDVVTYEIDRGGELVPESKRLYELVSSHTARRSYITNMLRDRMSPTAIMKSTGHKKLDTLSRYDRMSQEETVLVLSTASI